jgi:hypothetical protein
MFKQVLESFDYKISGGSAHMWQCWHTARFMDFESDHAHGSCVYSTEDQTVYCIEVNAKDDEQGKTAYRWLNPDYAQFYIDEAVDRGVDYKQAWDDVEWKDTDSFDDMCAKANAIFNGREFDPRVSIELDISDEDLLLYMRAAHERDLTFNQFVEQALQTMIDEHNADPEAFKARYANFKARV